MSRPNRFARFVPYRVGSFWLVVNSTVGIVGFLAFTGLATFVGLSLLGLLHTLTGALAALPLPVVGVPLYCVLLVVQYRYTEKRWRRGRKERLRQHDERAGNE